MVVQDKGFSRGFGIYGGSIIDADLVRTRSGEGDSASSVGYDGTFGEMFPAFFLEAMEPNSITIVGDESDDEAKAAAQEACGDSDNGTAFTRSRLWQRFLAMTESITRFCWAMLAIYQRYNLIPATGWRQVNDSLKSKLPLRILIFRRNSFRGNQLW